MMGTELERFIGKVVKRSSVRYLVTDLFRLHSLSISAFYGLALVNIESKTVKAGFVSSRIINFEDNSLIGFTLDNDSIFDYGVYLLDPLNTNVDRDLGYVDRMPKITRSIKRYAKQLMKDYYNGKNMYFSKMPQYRKIMRNLLNYYLFPDKCIIKKLC